MKLIAAYMLIICYISYMLDDHFDFEGNGDLADFKKEVDKFAADLPRLLQWRQNKL